MRVNDLRACRASDICKITSSKAHIPVPAGALQVCAKRRLLREAVQIYRRKLIEIRCALADDVGPDGWRQVPHLGVHPSLGARKPHWKTVKHAEHFLTLGHGFPQNRRDRGWRGQGRMLAAEGPQGMPGK